MSQRKEAQHRDLSSARQRRVFGSLKVEEGPKSPEPVVYAEEEGPRSCENPQMETRNSTGSEAVSSLDNKEQSSKDSCTKSPSEHSLEETDKRPRQDKDTKALHHIGKARDHPFQETPGPAAVEGEDRCRALTRPREVEVPTTHTPATAPHEPMELVARNEAECTDYRNEHQALREEDDSIENIDENCTPVEPTSRCVVAAHPEGQHVMLVEQLNASETSPGVRQEYVLLFQEEPGAEQVNTYVVEGELDGPIERIDSTDIQGVGGCTVGNHICIDAHVGAAAATDTVRDIGTMGGDSEADLVEESDDKPLAVRIDGRVHFRCDECDYVSKRRNYIKVHKQKVHVTPRAVPCHVCRAAFLSTPTLYAHMAEVHATELPYACEQCGYRAKARHRIASHRLSHDKEPRYKCGKCEFATRHKYLYSQHEYTHQEPLPFSCSLCDYKAKWRSSVYMHIKKRHGEQLLLAAAAGSDPWQDDRTEHQEHDHRGNNNGDDDIDEEDDGNTSRSNPAAL